MTFNRVQFFTPLHKILLVMASLILAIAVMMPSNQASALLLPSLSINPETSVNTRQPLAKKEPLPQRDNKKQIQW